jgi:hypothetical protein
MRDDVEPIRGESFFSSIDWKKMEAKEVVPPFRPDVVSHSLSISCNIFFKSMVLFVAEVSW